MGGQGQGRPDGDRCGGQACEQEAPEYAAAPCPPDEEGRARARQGDDARCGEGPEEVPHGEARTPRHEGVAGDHEERCRDGRARGDVEHAALGTRDEGEDRRGAADRALPDGLASGDAGGEGDHGRDARHDQGQRGGQHDAVEVRGLVPGGPEGEVDDVVREDREHGEGRPQHTGGHRDDGAVRGAVALGVAQQASQRGHGDATQGAVHLLDREDDELRRLRVDARCGGPEQEGDDQPVEAADGPVEALGQGRVADEGEMGCDVAERCRPGRTPRREGQDEGAERGGVAGRLQEEREGACARRRGGERDGDGEGCGRELGDGDGAGAEVADEEGRGHGSESRGEGDDAQQREGEGAAGQAVGGQGDPGGEQARGEHEADGAAGEVEGGDEGGRRVGGPGDQPAHASCPEQLGGGDGHEGRRRRAVLGRPEEAGEEEERRELQDEADPARGRGPHAAAGRRGAEAPGPGPVDAGRPRLHDAPRVGGAISG